MKDAIDPLDTLGAFSTLSNIDGSIDQHVLWATLEKVLSALGPQSVMYLRGVPIEAGTDACLETLYGGDLVLGRLVDEDFVTTVLSEPDLHKIDHFSSHWRRTLAPLVFDCVSGTRCPDAQRPLNHLMRDYGIRGGIIVPLRGDDGASCGHLSLILNDASPVTPSELPSATVTALAHLFHGYLSSALERKSSVLLSPRERECLQWIAAGLGTKQLSFRMGIGADTAEEYVRNARRKLGAATRAEAVARALSLGAIDL